MTPRRQPCSVHVVSNDDAEDVVVHLLLSPTISLSRRAGPAATACHRCTRSAHVSIYRTGPGPTPMMVMMIQAGKKEIRRAE